MMPFREQRHFNSIVNTAWRPFTSLILRIRNYRAFLAAGQDREVINNCLSTPLPRARPSFIVASMPVPEPEITPKILLEHMQRMGAGLQMHINELGTQMRDMNVEWKADMRDMEQRLTERIDRGERNLSQQIDAINHRLDALEIEDLPQRVALLEQRR